MLVENSRIILKLFRNITEYASVPLDETLSYLVST